MKLDRVIRVALAALILLVFVVATGALLFISESALNVWDRLKAGPPALLYAYIAIMLLLAVTALWLIWRLVVRRKIAPQRKLDATPLTKPQIEARLRDAEAAGIDVSEAQAELRELAARHDEVHLCFFGEVSAGKSSLIRALAPEADVVIDVVGGSTGDVRHYQWRSEDGAEILLTDVPGIGGTEEGLSEVATAEAQRADVVLFVCDSDLTRPEVAAIGSLLEFDKPLVIVLNKADRFSPDEQAALMEKLLERVDSVGGTVERDHVVAVSAGGEVEVVERGAAGDEETVRRTRPADIGVLVVAVNRLLAAEGEQLDVRRERAVFKMAAARLAEAEGEYRLQRSEQIIRSATRRAVLGALAAISPGTDIFIQGYIGTMMTQELCRLYGAAPRDLDIEEFLNLSQSRVGRALPLTLAVAGNGLKAFPGLGTVAGGAVHAVAYGLIFDALGRSLVLTLSKHGELLPDVAAREFEEGISEHLEAGVRRIARIALEEKKG
ncbi:MAG: 50S ribosome-binding GTPase [Gammaproteobacteria bacterium]|nr:50S ribosome-binding GTPase [Gammaproteobacteria bacterium]NNF49554.1 GTP-binding protein [Woeseiaceae bacterium]MBT8093848.1 50S ribosome-binding GTPase [Gammaproteobacteria bacterium]MBT8105809.1 50S ribosome-binding GTPase [Gammaproteobacteria bacterium]NNK25823.1 GTP-binding protein [Woeseiaceae bacterium]